MNRLTHNEKLSICMLLRELCGCYFVACNKVRDSDPLRSRLLHISTELLRLAERYRKENDPPLHDIEGFDSILFEAAALRESFDPLRRT